MCSPSPKRPAQLLLVQDQPHQFHHSPSDLLERLTMQHDIASAGPHGFSADSCCSSASCTLKHTSRLGPACRAKYLQSLALADNLPSLPYDVLTIILDYFVPFPSSSAHHHQQTRQELAQFAAFAVVSSDWYAFVAPRLYQNLFFSSAQPGQKSHLSYLSQHQQHLLSRTLLSTPALTGHVRSCIIAGPVSPNDEISTSQLSKALGKMHNLEKLELRNVDVAGGMYRSVASCTQLNDITLFGCIFVVNQEEQDDADVRFAPRRVVIQSCLNLRQTTLFTKLFTHPQNLEYLFIDNHVTSIVLPALLHHDPSHSPPSASPSPSAGNRPVQTPLRIEYLYAEPAQCDSKAFCTLLARCENLTRLGFSHGPHSLPLHAEPFAQLRAHLHSHSHAGGSVGSGGVGGGKKGSGNRGEDEAGWLSNLTHWSGPSELLPFFVPRSGCRNSLEHVALDQLVGTFCDGSSSPSSPSGSSEDASAGPCFVDLLRPRNLGTTPAMENIRIEAIKSLLSQDPATSPLKTVDVVLASSKSVREIMQECRVELRNLRIKCTETEGHTVRRLWLHDGAIGAHRPTDDAGAS